jgi:hypothetical protein
LNFGFSIGGESAPRSNIHSRRSSVDGRSGSAIENQKSKIENPNPQEAGEI